MGVVLVIAQAGSLLAEIAFRIGVSRVTGDLAEFTIFSNFQLNATVNTT